MRNDDSLKDQKLSAKALKSKENKGIETIIHVK